LFKDFYILIAEIKPDILYSMIKLTLILGLRGASLTSTAYDRVTETEAAILDEDIVKYRLVASLHVLYLKLYI